MTNPENLLKKIEDKEKEWKDEIIHLRSKATGFETEARIQLEEQIDLLNKKLKMIEIHTAELKKNSDEIWHDFGDNIARSWNELVKTIDTALLNLKK